MPRLFSTGGAIARWAYPVAALAILLSQHAALALAAHVFDWPLHADGEFWLTPVRSLARTAAPSNGPAVFAFLFSLANAALLAWLSFRRARMSGQGFVLAALVVVPVVQIFAVAVLAGLPVRPEGESPPPREGAEIAAAVEGLLVGLLLIVFAVTVSTLAFGSYGWGLFVLTPLLVGITTGYIANRDGIISAKRTNVLVLAAGGLGCLALIVLALEGLICIVLAAPLGAAAVLIGGTIGRRLAVARAGGPKPMMSVAVLPLVFALEAALPPAAAIETREAIDIAAPPQVVWRALTAGDDVQPAPGLVFRLGLAYPIRSRIIGQGVGAVRIGIFSTGVARERITTWAPGRRLAFAVLSQPPAMTELSPYAEVHAPHVRGYFDTVSTSFDLQPLPGGGTRLVLEASHVLRLDPVLYWEPVARWAIHQNSERVLRHIRSRAEAAAGRTPAHG